ncbi:MAG: ComEA family DNA-binding protein [Polyangiaceae bacterium]
MPGSRSDARTGATPPGGGSLRGPSFGSRLFSVALRLVGAAALLAILAWIATFVAPPAEGAPARNDAEAPPSLGDASDGGPPSVPTGPPGDVRPSTTTVHGTRATPEDPVVLNTASLDDFRRLPGIGAKRARALADLRDRLGRFRHVEDLMRVKGIGRGTLKKLRPLVRLSKR